MNKSLLTKKRPLTEEQKADADRLLALWVAWQERQKAEGKKPITQGEFGYKHDLGSQGMVWQYLHGAAPLNLKAAMAFAVAMDCAIEEISPALANTAKRAGEAVALTQAPEPIPRDVLTPFGAIRQAEVRRRFRDALPHILRPNASVVIREAGKPIYIFDYRSEDLHAELLQATRKGPSRALSTAILHFAVEDTPRDRRLIIIDEDEPTPLPTFQAAVCKHLNIEVFFVKTIQAASDLVADTEPKDKDLYEDYEE
jgi:hypothetical protein